MVIIEMNPRVSRSSALASQGHRLPIAKIAAKLAVAICSTKSKHHHARNSRELRADHDYVVVKVPRFAFEKIRAGRPNADERR